MRAGKKLRMLSGLKIAVFLVWATSSTQTTAQPCLCSALQPASLQVNCSSLELVQLPHLPSDTTELHVQNNRLTSVPPGLFDKLVGLKKVSLSGNPFHCDCNIQYLRNWLLTTRAVVSEEPTCASPSSVAQRAITELSDDYFSSCALATCTDGTFDTVMGVMLCCLIVLLLWSLRLAKTSTFILYIDERHSGFQADSLRSLKPKHRRRLHTAQPDSLTFEGDEEKPPFNMELLPQVLDVLQKKHNIKIKAT
ncbi:glycoprotein IX (platelet) isoform X2 [Plectropomus leopardus]|uniref:glycoprotein IX (platelet) isoform X2 n=1 Tax=Plectropomus leopardus TaxID=160734 RepID=UPI001C4DCC09|nr:glycoprotein IX (platelet) isoform X2 [Plectropomus leopardus]XP_042348603.1 glycoprotein IX (platelet) isoform X2 [Plectropomus leopardus]